MPKTRSQDTPEFSEEECKRMIDQLHRRIRPVVEHALQLVIGDVQFIDNPRNVITNLLPQIDLIQFLQPLELLQQPCIDMHVMQQQLAVTTQQELEDEIINIADLPEVQLDRHQFVDLFMQGLQNLFVPFMQNMQRQSRKRDREEENQNQAEKFPRIEVLEDDAEIPAVTSARIPVDLLVAPGSRMPAMPSYVEPSSSSSHHFGGHSSSNSDNPPAAAHHDPNANHHQHLEELPPRFNPPVQPNNMGLDVPALLSTVAAGVLALIAKQWFTGHQEGNDDILKQCYEIDNPEITSKRLLQLALVADNMNNAEQLDRIARHENCQKSCATFILNAKNTLNKTKEYIKNREKSKKTMKI